MTTMEIARRLVELGREGRPQDAVRELYAENIVSIEPPSSPSPRTEGLKAVLERGQRFDEMIEVVHSGSISDPIIKGNFFSVGWSIDITMKDQQRLVLDEICLYKTENGKIVEVQFFY
jgi:hypothetical protein